jgi:Spy/CpxP family protein refolding chaperone
MRKSLHIVVAGALALAACSRSSNKTQPVPAQTSVDAGTADGGARGGRGGGRRDEMLLRGITLSDAQRTQIDSIRARYRAQFDANRGQNNGGAPDPAMRQQMMDMMQRQSAEIRAVLTPDQQAQFDRNIEDMRSRAGRRGAGGGAGGGTPPR